MAQQQQGPNNIFIIPRDSHDGIVKLEPGWRVVKDGMNKLARLLDSTHLMPAAQRQQLDPLQYTLLYTTIYKMCSQNAPHNYCYHLYQRFRKLLQSHTNDVVVPAIRAKRADHELILQELAKRWDTHQVFLQVLVRLFGYIDYTTILSMRAHKFGFVGRPDTSYQLPSMWEVGVASFEGAAIHVHVKEAILGLINRERDGGRIDRALMKNVINIFMEVEGVPTVVKEAAIESHQNLEMCLIDDAEKYYRRKARAWIEKDTCAEYMVKAEECLRLEEERARDYLCESMEGELLSKIRLQLLLNPPFKQQLFEENQHSGCHALLADGRVEDLKRMYKLFYNIPHDGGLDHILSCFREHLADATSALVKQLAEPSEMKTEQAQVAFVQNLIDLHENYSKQIVNECFARNSLFHKEVKKAFSLICKKHNGRSSAELLATYCDNTLLKISAGKSTSSSSCATDELMSEDHNLQVAVHILVAYVSDKDIFSMFFRKKFSRRLLSDKGPGMDLSCDKSFLTKLKQLCGSQFTASMEGMLKDVTLAKETEALFREYVNALHRSSTAEASDDHHPLNNLIDLRVTTLTTVHWPTIPNRLDYLALPTEMLKSLQTFNDFYQTKSHHSRKLTWINSLGTCNVVGNFKAKKIDLMVTTLQAVVLLQFSSTERLSFSEIKSTLNLKDDDDEILRRLLHSLSCAKYKILNKVRPAPGTNTSSAVGLEDCFEFNAEFTDKMRRIRIPMPVAKDEKKAVIENVEKDRRYTVDACLVRIMKGRKVLPYQELIAECVQELQRLFKPDIKFVKKRIEDLIHREFLERDAENPSVFKYLA